jgi:hypothetical protein
MKTTSELRQELEAEKAELQKQLEDVNDRLITLDIFEERFGSHIAINSDPAAMSDAPIPRRDAKPATKRRGRQNKWPMSIGEAAEKVLKKAENHELPILDILKGVHRLGVKPSRQTLTSGLIKDHRNRFERSGEGKYKLKQ